MLETPTSQPETFSRCDDSEIEVIRHTLKALEKSIEDKRVSLITHAAEAERLNKAWELTLHRHRIVEREIKATGNTTQLILEGLSFDLDVLKHAFQRWMYRVDRNF